MTRRLVVPLSIAGGTLLLLLLGAAMLRSASGNVNETALASSAKPVTVVAAAADTYRPTHRYVGTTAPWIEAKVGPQLVSAYVETVLVRPGAIVKRGDVLATLDCATASAQLAAVRAQARSLSVTQQALAKEAARVTSLLDGNYASPNEVEQKQAESESKQAQLLAVQAQMAGTSLEVSDCVLRAPFAGEIADRQVDPGAFVRPGSAIATLVDRSTVRIVVDVPESDFTAVAPGTAVRVKIVATGQALTGKIARRAPAADPATRTIHVELDVADADHQIPVGTTADLEVDVGAAQAATRIPLIAASVKGGKASLFVVDHGVAHRMVVPVVGERGADLLVDPKVPAGAQVVTEGRGALVDGDHVEAGAS